MLNSVSNGYFWSNAALERVLESRQFTMDIYTHVNMQAKQKAVDAASVIFPATRSVESLPGVGAAADGDDDIILATSFLESKAQPA